MDADDVAASRAVVLDERRRLAVVQLEAAVDRVGRVVRPVLHRRSLQHPVEQLLPVGHLELEDDVERAVEVAEQLVQRLGLHHRAWKAVEDEAGIGVAAVEPVADQPDHQVVVDEVAALVDGLQLATERRLPLLHLPDHVPGRDVGDAVGRGDLLRLSALPGALRSKQQDVYRRKPS